MKKQTVLVLGATGTAGRAYADALARAGHEVRGAIRPGRDRGLGAGVTPVEVDLSSGEGTDAAMEGADAVVIALLGRGADPVGDERTITRAAFEGAVRADVGRIVYTSVHLADASTGVPHFDVKAELERELAGSGVAWTVLRPTTFMEALDAAWLREPTLSRGVLASPIGADVPIAYVSAADVARLAVLSLEDHRLEDRIVAIGGPGSVTYRELLPLLSELSGRRLQYEALDPESLEAMQPHIAAMVRHFNERGFTCERDPLLDELGIALTDVRSFLRRSSWVRVQSVP